MNKLLYGNTTILSDRCRECKHESFILDGKFVCCGRVAEGVPKRWKRMGLNLEKRRRVPQWEIDEMLQKQHHRCFYCGILFDTPEYRKGKLARKNITVDHMVCMAFNADNSPENRVLSCSICNNIKSDLCFQTIEEIKVYVTLRRKTKGFTTRRPDIELSDLRDAVPPKPKVAKVLLKAVPVGGVEQTKPTGKTRRRGTRVKLSTRRKKKERDDCPNCGRSFLKKPTDKLYCTDRCRNQSWAKKYRAPIGSRANTSENQTKGQDSYENI